MDRHLVRRRGCNLSVAQSRRFFAAVVLRATLSLTVVFGGVPVTLGAQETGRGIDSLRATAERKAQGENSGDREESIALWERVANSYEAAGRYPDATNAFVTAAEILSDLGNMDSALVLQHGALTLAAARSDSGAMGLLLTEIGLTYGAPHKDSAFAYLRRGLIIRHAIHAGSGEAETLSNIGVVFAQLGRADSALSYLRSGLPLLVDTASRAAYEQTLFNIGQLMLQLGRADSALSTFRRVAVLAKAVADDHTEGLAYNAIGTAFEARWQTSPGANIVDSSLYYYNEALSIAERRGEKQSEAAILNNIGLAHRRLNQGEPSIAFYTRSLALRRELHDTVGEGRALQNLGIEYGTLRDSVRALSDLREALSIHRAAGDTAWIWLGLKEIATVYHRDLATPKLGLATAYYDSAAAALAAFTSTTGSDPDRLTFEEQQANLALFDEWALAELARGSEIGAIRSTEASLRASERGRAQGLLALMHSSALPPQHTPRSEAAISPFNEHLDAHRVQSAWVEYLVTPDTLLLWLGGPKETVRVWRRAIRRDTLASLVSDMRRGLGVDGDGTSSTSVTQAQSLGVDTAHTKLSEDSLQTVMRHLRLILLPDSLLADIPVDSPLAIIANGPLSMLPFAVLPAHSKAAGLEYALYYGPSLASLVALSARDSLTRPLDLRQSIVVGNPTMPTVVDSRGQRVELESLPNAELEAKTVARLLGTTALIESHATQSAVVGAFLTAPVIHLATHGVAYSSEAQARESFIALAPGGGYNGVLTVAGIMHSVARVNATLVVLSACQTALGNLTYAEGTVGFQRAFLARGARSLLVSLWSISDEGTATLMEQFYTHWLRDPDRPSKAEALRRAEQYLVNHGESDPRSWAAFQLVGSI